MFAFSGGINNYSGNPAAGGGTSCTACHNGGLAPTVSITGPTTVQPSSVSTYTLTISGGQQNLGGLDVSVDGGTLVSTQANTRILANELTHRLPAAAAANGSVSWSFNWQAPAAAGNYMLYGAGVSADGNGITTGDNGSTAVLLVTVSAAAPVAPVAAITAPMTAQVGATVLFDGSGSSDVDGFIAQYDWDFGDGTTGTGAQATHGYTVAGVYTVTLTVTDDAGLTNQTFVDITVGGAMVPVADPGGPYTGEPGQTLNFDGSGSTHVSAITRYIWDYGDGSVLEITTGPTTSHVYTTAGVYTLTLAVQDSQFLTGVASTTVTVAVVAPPPPPPPPPPAVTGEELYVTNCQGCHGVNGAGGPFVAVTGATANQISSAIINIGAMNAISLAPDEVILIANYLGSGTPPPPPAPTTGAEYYNAYCAACHGANGEGGLYEGVRNSSANEIQSAINSESLMQSISLSYEALQAIADFLSGSAPPPPPPGSTTGQDLYVANCQGCHGVGGTGGAFVAVTGATAGQITNAIAGIGAMQSISLSATDIQAIAEFLAGGGTTPPPPAPVTGEEIYIAKCQACHGANGGGGSARGIVGVTASQITSAISSVSSMQSISLTAGETQAVATFLGSVARPTDGAGLYDMFCGSCHGPEGRGGAEEDVRGSSYRDILDAISSEREMQGLAGVLSSDEVRKIADYLSGGYSGGGDDHEHD